MAGWEYSANKRLERKIGLSRLLGKEPSEAGTIPRRFNSVLRCLTMAAGSLLVSTKQGVEWIANTGRQEGFCG